MKFRKNLFLPFIGLWMLVSACGSPSQPLQPTLTLSAPTPTATSAPIPTQIATQIIPTIPPAEYPDWVGEFSDPILAAVDTRKPDYQDEFKSINRGWFYFVPGSLKNPHYADTEQETLQVKLPAKNENKDTWVYNPLLNRKNFVMTFDFQFEATQPEDTVRFQFDQTKTQSIAFDLSKDLTWTLHYGERSDWQSISGAYEYFPPEKISVLFIISGTDCAVYLKDAPLTYLKNCRAAPAVRSVPWAVTFHILAQPGHTAAFVIDNLKLWDLDQIPGLTQK